VVIRNGLLAAIVIVSTVCTYVLWALVNTGTFVPYQGESYVPLTVNILTFIFLFTIIVTGIATIGYVIGFQIYKFVRKKDIILEEKIVIAVYGGFFIYLFITLLLHVFKILHIVFSLLSFIIFWSIVVYGKFRRKTRFKKYLPKGSRGAESKDPEQVSDE
jgi:hypothetical protein